MKDDVQEQRLVSRWALPASVAVHLSVVALVIFGLPVSFLQPDEEKAIEVDLVPPPKPEDKAKAEPPPQEKPKEPEQAKPQEPPPAQEEAARQAAQRVINPVFQFGEKDAGPREARDGNSPEEATAAPESEREPEKQEEQQKPAEPPALTASRSQNPIPEPQAAEKPASNPADAQKKQKAAGPKEAKKLFSPKVTGDVIAMTGMGALPRGVRAGRLCVTELRDQLRNGLPPYYPDLLPSFRLGEGNVIDAPTAAFRVGGEWYDLSYRCEVDRNATRVVDFAFRVGGILPPGERQRRGLPSR